MKTLATFSLALLASWECSAQTSLYDGSTLVLDIPCVALYQNAVPVLNAGGSITTYKVRMTNVAGKFQLNSATAVAPVDECPGRYDSATAIYTDLVSFGDDAYQVTMTNVGGSFTLNSAVVSGPAKTSLWVVSNGSNTVYLGGVMYALRPSDHPLPRAFDEAYAKSSWVYFETDRDDPIETGANLTQTQAIALMYDAEGKLLSEVLDSSTYTLLTNYLTTKNIAIAAAEKWSAQMLMSIVPAEDVLLQVGATTAKGADTYFVAKAKSDGKPILGLETAASVRTMQQTANEGLENELVRNTLEDLASGEAAEDFLQQLTAWRRGDVGTIQQAYAEVRIENRKDYDLIQTNRNLAWLPKIEQLLNTSESELVLVGAAHVTGPEGLITLLRSRGYTVKKY